VAEHERRRDPASTLAQKVIAGLQALIVAAILGAVNLVFSMDREITKLVVQVGTLTDAVVRSREVDRRVTELEVEVRNLKEQLASRGGK